MKIGVYVHLPFCLAKCHYCDFVSYPVLAEQEHTLYLHNLLQEARMYQREMDIKEVKSLYIGGGTPTCLSGGLLVVLLESLQKIFSLRTEIEVTVEGNPGTLDKEKLRILRQLGVNRLSLGVQSFRQEDLKALGRIHSVEEVYQTYQWAREVGFTNINIDLMYGLLGQTLSGWQENLQKGVDLRPEHMSLYQLKIEPHTYYDQLLKTGQITQFDPDLASDMYEQAIYFLVNQGYVHYEISNFSQPGKESKHNQIYWHNEEYLGLGAGACSYLKGFRYSNFSDLQSYHEAVCQKRKPIGMQEEINKETAMAETIFLGLRLRRGVNKEKFFAKHQVFLEEKYGTIIDKLVAQGLLVNTPTHIFLSKRGLFLANDVMSNFL